LHHVVQGENAWVFVDEDSIQDTVKHYFKFEEELFIQAKRTAAKGVEVKPPTSLSTIVMDDKILSNTEVSPVCVLAGGNRFTDVHHTHACLCTCAPTHTHTHTHTQAYTHEHTHTHTGIHTRTGIHTYMHRHTHTSTHIHTRTGIDTHTCTGIHTKTQMNRHAHTHRNRHI